MMKAGRISSISTVTKKKPTVPIAPKVVTTRPEVLRRQTMVISKTMSPLLKRTIAKEVSTKRNDVRLNRERVSLSTFPNKPKKPIERRSISTIHRSLVNRPLPTVSSKPTAKKQCSDVIKAIVKDKRSSLAAKKLNDSASERAKKAKVRKSVAFNVSMDKKRTPSVSPSLKCRLEHWLAARGKTPSRFRHLHCFGVHLSDTKRKPRVCTPRPKPNRNPLVEINNTSSLDLSEMQESEILKEDKVEDLEKMKLAIVDLIELAKRSYPTQGISDWLDEMYECRSDIQTLASYWECRSQLSELNGDIEEAVGLLDRGISMNAQPVQMLIDLRSKVNSKHRMTCRSTRLINEVETSNAFDSTIIHYELCEQPPPFCKTFQSLDFDGRTPVFATPVRRSRRLSRSVCSVTPLAITPLTSSASRRRTVTCIPSLDEFSNEYGNVSLFRLANPALWEEEDSD